MPTSPLSWDVFDGFTAHRPSPTRGDWATVDVLIDAARRYTAEVTEPFARALDEWDGLLQGIGGDPAMSDWRSVRFLQLGREEAWSDWLQHLFATSTTGTTCAALFGGTPTTPGAYADPTVEREVSVGRYRADLVIHWGDHCHTHVEVKVGDQSFAKTFDTAAALEARFGGKWTHYILLPEQDLSGWQKAAAGNEKVSALTWSEVAVAIRRGLLGDEKLRWKAWAAGFCGLVEQKLLGHTVGRQKLTTVAALERRIAYMRLCATGGCDERERGRVRREGDHALRRGQSDGGLVRDTPARASR